MDVARRAALHLRRAAGRPRRDRDAQLPRVGVRVLGRHRRRRRVVVPLNAWWTGPELAYGLTDSGSVVLFADEERAERVAPLLGDTAVRNVVLARTERYMPNAETFADAVGDLAPSARCPTSTSPRRRRLDHVHLGHDGKPKGAVATHRNFIAHLMNGMYRRRGGRGRSASSAGRRTPTAPARDAPHLPALPRRRAAVAPAAPHGDRRQDRADVQVGRRRGGRPDRARGRSQPSPASRRRCSRCSKSRMHKDGSSPPLTGVASGATLVPPELVRRIDNQFASRAAPTNGYGLTETSGAAIANSGKGLRRPARTASVRPSPP